MKVFISWSGTRSHEVAKLLDEWINCVIQAVDPWLSSKNIDKGSIWFSQINKQLADSDNGIICLTRKNLNNPWILFESGALAKGLESSRVFTFLVDLEPIDVKDPLAQFNHTMPNKEGLYRLVSTINLGLEEKGLKQEILDRIFKTYWPEFERKFNDILDSTPEEEVKETRSENDLLNEILYSVRGMEKRLRDVESSGFKESFPVNKPNILQRLYSEQIEDMLMEGRPKKEIYDEYKEVLSDSEINVIMDQLRVKRNRNGKLPGAITSKMKKL